VRKKPNLGSRKGPKPDIGEKSFNRIRTESIQMRVGRALIFGSRHWGPRKKSERGEKGGKGKSPSRGRRGNGKTRANQ